MKFNLCFKVSLISIIFLLANFSIGTASNSLQPIPDYYTAWVALQITNGEHEGKFLSLDRWFESQKCDNITSMWALWGVNLKAESAPDAFEHFFGFNFPYVDKSSATMEPYKIASSPCFSDLKLTVMGQGRCNIGVVNDRFCYKDQSQYQNSVYFPMLTSVLNMWLIPDPGTPPVKFQTVDSGSDFTIGFPYYPQFKKKDYTYPPIFAESNDIFYFGQNHKEDTSAKTTFKVRILFYPDASKVPALKPDQVALFEHPNYKGRAFVINSSFPETTALSKFAGSDRAWGSVETASFSSVKIGHLVTVRFYGEKNYEGSSFLKTIGNHEKDITAANLNGQTVRSIEIFDARKYILTSKNCAYCNLTMGDFSNLNLTDRDLTGANIAGADFTNAKLDRTNFSYALFQGSEFSDNRAATLTDSNLVNVNFSNATLDGANMKEVKFYSDGSMNNCEPGNWAGQCAIAYKASIIDAILTKANLERANFSSANLTRASLVGAKMKNANFNYAALDGAAMKEVDFSSDISDDNLNTCKPENWSGQCAVAYKASMVRTILTRANLTRANFSSANLAGANINNANLRQCNFSDSFLSGSDKSDNQAASLAGAYMKNANLSNANLNGAALNNVNLYSDYQGPCTTEKWNGDCVSLHGATMNSTIFINAYLNGADMSDSSPQGAIFTNAMLAGAYFTNAKLGRDPNTKVETNFIGAFIQGTDFTNAAVNGANFENAYVDCSSKGNEMVFKLSPVHVDFAGWWGTEQSVCAKFSYHNETIVPKTDSSNICPDGSSKFCGSTCKNWPDPVIPMDEAEQKVSIMSPPSGAEPVCEYDWSLQPPW